MSQHRYRRSCGGRRRICRTHRDFRRSKAGRGPCDCFVEAAGHPQNGHAHRRCEGRRRKCCKAARPGRYTHAELLPADKVERVEELLETKKAQTESSLLSGMVSMMHRYSPARISESQWAALAPTRPLKRRMWCLWTISPPKSQQRCAFPKKRCVSCIRTSCFTGCPMLLLGALGVTNMQLRFADVGVMVLAVLNATRALRTGTGIEPTAKQTGTGLSVGLCRSVLPVETGIKIATAALTSSERLSALFCFSF